MVIVTSVDTTSRPVWKADLKPVVLLEHCKPSSNVHWYCMKVLASCTPNLVGGWERLFWPEEFKLACLRNAAIQTLPFVNHNGILPGRLLR